MDVNRVSESNTCVTTAEVRVDALIANPPATLAERVQHARIQAGYTQVELASLVGISRIRLAKIESGAERHVPRSVLTAVAAALSVAEPWLRHGEGNAARATDEWLDAESSSIPIAKNSAIDLRSGLALLRGLRRQYVIGRLTHRQLLTVCALAHELARNTPKGRWALEHPTAGAGGRIRARRVFLGWSIEQLAADAGLSVEVVSQMEHGLCTDPHAFAAAEAALNIDIQCSAQDENTPQAESMPPS